METARFKEDYQSELPDGSDGWEFKKGTKVNVLEIDKVYGVLCEKHEYSFYCEPELLEIS